MDERQQDNIIREKLHDMQLPVDADVWQGIEGSLRRRKLRRLFLYASSAAVVVVALLLLSGRGESDGVPTDDVGYIAAATPSYNAEGQNSLPDNTFPVSDPDIPSQASFDMVAIQEASPVKEEGRIAEEDVHREEAQQHAENSTPAAEVAVLQEDGHIAVAGEDATREGVSESVSESVSEGVLSVEDLLEVGDGGKGKRRYTVAFSSGVIPGSSAAVSGSTIKASSAGAGAISQSYSIEQISDTRYSLPLNLGIQFQLAIKENMALGIGINYTMLRSRYDCLINKKQFEVTQVLHYVGIPLNVYGLIVEKDKFNFYVNAGAMFEKGIRGVYDLKSYNQKEHSSTSINGIDFSVNAGLGVEYKFGNTVGLYFEPNLVYFINSDVPRSIRTDQPLQVKAELGARFHF